MSSSVQILDLARELLAIASQPAAQNAQRPDLRRIAVQLSTAVLAGQGRATLVFDRGAGDQARAALAPFCAQSRRHSGGRGITARVIPYHAPPVRGELIDLDCPESGQHRLLISPYDSAEQPAEALVVSYDLYSDLDRVQILCTER